MTPELPIDQQELLQSNTTVNPEKPTRAQLSCLCQTANSLQTSKPRVTKLENAHVRSLLSSRLKKLFQATQSPQKNGFLTIIPAGTLQQRNLGRTALMLHYTGAHYWGCQNALPSLLPPSALYSIPEIFELLALIFRLWFQFFHVEANFSTIWCYHHRMMQKYERKIGLSWLVILPGVLLESVPVVQYTNNNDIRCGRVSDTNYQTGDFFFQYF